MNHGNSEISKIKKMAAFWSLNIDFSCAFRPLGGKKKWKETSDFEIRGSHDKGTSGEYLLQISSQSINWNVRYPVSQFKKYGFERNTFEVSVTRCTKIFMLTLRAVHRFLWTSITLLILRIQTNPFTQAFSKAYFEKMWKKNRCFLSRTTRI